MKLMTGKYEWGKYYLAYNNREGTFKKAFMFKYDGLFTNIDHSIFNGYIGLGSKTVTLTTDVSKFGDATDQISFELSEDEIYQHITMELITQNL